MPVIAVWRKSKDAKNENKLTLNLTYIYSDEADLHSWKIFIKYQNNLISLIKRVTRWWFTTNWVIRTIGIQTRHARFLAWSIERGSKRSQSVYVMFSWIWNHCYQFPKNCWLNRKLKWEQVILFTSKFLLKHNKHLCIPANTSNHNNQSTYNEMMRIQTKPVDSEAI